MHYRGKTVYSHSKQQGPCNDLADRKYDMGDTTIIIYANTVNRDYNKLHFECELVLFTVALR